MDFRFGLSTLKNKLELFLNFVWLRILFEVMSETCHDGAKWTMVYDPQKH